MKLFTYYRSSAAYRVRIAMNLKNLEREETYVHLRKGEQTASDYLKRNPQGLVPTLIDGEVTLGQSLAILEYLEEKHPAPALLPAGVAARARCRQLALAVCCDIHPINNLKVLNYLTGEMGLSEDQRLQWYRHWSGQGMQALEALLTGDPATGRFCHGDAPTLADVCLVPQIYNCQRFDVDLSGCPTVLAVNDNCLALDAFTTAAPDVQPDAE